MIRVSNLSFLIANHTELGEMHLMIIYESHDPNEIQKRYRPAYERIKVIYPQFLLETTAAEIFQTIPSDKKNKSLDLPKPLVYEGTVIDYPKITVEHNYRNFYFTTTIKVPAGKDVILLNQETGEAVTTNEPAKYYLSVKLVDGFKYIWEPFAYAYVDEARKQLMRPVPDDTILLKDVAPEDWVIAIYDFIPKMKTSGNSKFSQIVFKNGFRDAFLFSDIVINCSCSWFDKQLKKSGLDWTQPVGLLTGRLNKFFTSTIDTQKGQELSKHHGSAIAKAIEHGEELLRDESDRFVKSDKVTKRSHPIGSRGRGGYQSADGQYVVNTGFIYNKDGQPIAYANGDPLDVDDNGVAQVRKTNPDGSPVEHSTKSRKEPCSHITRMLLGVFTSVDRTYSLCQALGQRMGTTLWVNGKPNERQGLDNAWRAWTETFGRSLVAELSNKLKRL